MKEQDIESERWWDYAMIAVVGTIFALLFSALFALGVVAVGFFWWLGKLDKSQSATFYQYLAERATLLSLLSAVYSYVDQYGFMRGFFLDTELIWLLCILWAFVAAICWVLSFALHRRSK